MNERVDLDAHISTLVGPPLHIAASDDELDVTRAKASGLGVRTYVIDGELAQDKADFMIAIGIEMDFFSGFGENWDAVTDCLRDVGLEEGYVLMVKNTELLLGYAKPGSLQMFLGILSRHVPDVRRRGRSAYTSASSSANVTSATRDLDSVCDHAGVDLRLE